jgi:ribosome-binding protein aMBF1 (putative translation factor)
LTVIDLQIIRTPSGDEMVVIPRAEYEALVAAANTDAEDEEDIAIYDARKADLAASRDSVLPPEVSVFMMRGDSLLRAVRRWRGISQSDLAEEADISQGYLSDLESGRRTGTLEKLQAISRIVGIDLT